MSSSQSAAPQFYVSPAVQHLSVHLDTFRYQNPQVDRLAVGALILHPNTATANSPRLLLLQRSNSNRCFPRVWEVPTGTCDSADETILHSLARGVSEKTGMRVNNVVRQVEGIEYFTMRGVKWAKICFLVGVDEVTGQEAVENVRLRAVRSEHRASSWASLNSLEDFELMTDYQRQVVRSGFGAFEEWCTEGNRALGDRMVLLYL